MSKQKISASTPSATSSPESEGGAEHLSLQDGNQTDLFGQGHPHVSRLVAQELTPHSTTSAIYGLPGTTSSGGADLGQFLVSRLQHLSSTGGSTERQQIWQQRSTDLGLSYYRLQVSMPRTAEKGYSLWPTPATRDYKDSGDLDKSRWRKDGKERNDTAPRVAFGAHQLSTAATKSTEQPHYNPKFSLWLMGYPKVWAEWAYSKARATQSSRKQRQK
tara:strand:- start:147 stop:797 length:651 start_codon:yes stop_codon:yes gene_type:complete